jgi:hypothetical protein
MCCHRDTRMSFDDWSVTAIELMAQLQRFLSPLTVGL